LIGKAPLAGGAIATLVTNPAGAPSALTVAAGFLYWSDGTGAVNRIPTVGGAVETLIENQGVVGSLVVDSSGVYRVGVGQISIDCGASGGSIVFLRFGSAQPTTLVGGLANAGSLAVFRGVVYFSFNGPHECDAPDQRYQLVRWSAPR
jgi:hypothetical protein